MRTITTGDGNFDAVLGGGLPAGSLIVLAGAPGAGKTILAQQICFANATAERKALYYSTWSESHEKLVRHLEPFSFFDGEAVGERVEFLHLAELAGGSGGIEPAAAEIVRRSFEARPAVIVIDSSKALHDVVPPDELRRAIYDLASRVAYTDAVLLLVGEYTPAETRTQPEFAIADGIVQLENESHGPTDRRWLRVLKLRGAEVAPGKHSFRLDPQGFTVFPRLETTLPSEAVAIEGRAATGAPGVDDLIGGGIPRGDSALVVGPAGVGKTLLALHFTDEGLARGERCIYLSFQESEAQLRAKAAAIGMDWSGEADDRLTIRHIPPVEVDLDVVAEIVRGALVDGSAQRVVVDSLAELAFAARETERFPAYVWSLAGFVRAAGGTTFFTNESASLGESADLGGLSFLFDDVVLLRYVEIESELRRGLNVLKMRRSDHDKGLFEFRVGATGIELRDQLRDVSGLLGWSALRRD
jgi:circadian clock protein KaiC